MAYNSTTFRGPGTEIIRCASFREIDSTIQKLIIGEKHHIYTVLSIVVHADNVNTAGNYVKCSFIGWDSKGSASAATMDIFQQPLNSNETFVWNDKFSFNGTEPNSFSAPLDDATKQDAICDQGSSTSQYLQILTAEAADDIDVLITFIDQNNA